ncbi:uncharacterized protein LOC103317698 [Nasonia vitripennis]|uniref:CCHC-type domain-containing protein n=1 Tax=Nasonia vitripennis TaxID=7425 RepID=A0A7M7H8V6_NASVI|nr:uncharacterized protein LOC103317698 [Nasonia vitripennis]
MESLKTAIQTAIGKAGKGRGKISRITLEIRGIDSLTTQDDVRNAITAETGEEDAKVHLFEPNTREQRVAVVEIDQIKTTALLKKGKIRIGCINCRVRVRANPTRCYRCLGYGHVKVRCKGPDRSVNCWKCGASGHKAALCTVPAQQRWCFLCKDAKMAEDKTVYAPGTDTCAVFRAALKVGKSQG